MTDHLPGGRFFCHLIVKILFDILCSRQAPLYVCAMSGIGRLAQLGERHVYTVDVGGSSPSPPTIRE